MSKLTIEEMQEVARSRGGVCLSDKYVNEKVKLKWKCKEGHIWVAKVDNIRSGKWCPYCARNVRLTIQDMRKLAETRGGKCLSTEYKNIFSKLKWQCSKGHIWEAISSNVKYHNKWCPFCARNSKFTLDDMRKIAESRRGRCLTEKYTNMHTKMEWQCSKGHIWKAKPHDIKNDNTWCPECSSHKSERICRKFFETMFNAKFPKIRPDWLKSYPKSSKRFNLELDGYNEKLKLAFEFQGHQHYVHSKQWHKKRTLRMQKDRDEEKRKLCQANGIILIEIPWKIKLENMGKYIEEQCTIKGIKPPNSKDIDYRSFDIYKEMPVPKTHKERYWERKLKNPEEFRRQKRESDQRYLAKHRDKLKEYHKRKYWKNRDQINLLRRQKTLERIGSLPPSDKRYGERVTRSKEEYLNELNQIAESRGGRCLSTSYVNAKTKIKFQCKEGHIWLAAPHHVKKGSWCPKCAGNTTLTIEEMQKLAKSKDGECLSKIYVNSKTKLEWQCGTGHVWKTIPEDVKRGSWCPKCYSIKRRGKN